MADENPGPWSPDLIKRLEEEGLIPPLTRRVIIDCKEGAFVEMHTFGHAREGDKLIEVLAAELHPAGVKKEDNSAG